MPRPYPNDLRERVVTAWNNGEGTYEELATRFMVGRATVDRWIARDRHLGDVSAFPMGGARHAYVVTKEGEEFLRDAVTETPDSSRQELVDAYEQEFGVLVSLTAMGDTLRRMGLTRKRGRSVRRRLAVPT